MGAPSLAPSLRRKPRCTGVCAGALALNKPPVSENNDKPALPDAKNEPINAGRSLLIGSIWMIGVRWGMRMIGLVSTMILARLLTPEDFGLIAMVMLAYGLLETISYAGADLALMRPGADTRAHFNTAWTVQILQGLFIAVCLVIAAPFIASYFKEPRAQLAIYVVALRPLIESFGNIGVVAFRKELDFGREFRFAIYTKLLNFVIVVAAAYLLRNYWALLLGSLVSSVASVAVSYRMHAYRPSLSLARIREIWGFSQWLMISRVGSYLNRKCDEFVVGGYAGTAAMGNYHVASELATLPSNEVVMPVRRAMFPTLSKMAGKGAEFTQAVLASFSAIAALCLFISATLLVSAPELVAVVLGGKWQDAVPLMRWMAVFGAFSALTLILEVPLWVAGRTDTSATQAWLELAIIVPASLYGVIHYGVEGAAAARAGVSMLVLPLMMMLTARYGSVSVGQLLGALWRPLVAASLMAALIELLPWAFFEPAMVRLAAKCSLCLLVYPALLGLLWVLSGRPAGVEATAIGHIRSMVTLRRAARS